MYESLQKCRSEKTFRQMSRIVTLQAVHQQQLSQSQIEEYRKKAKSIAALTGDDSIAVYQNASFRDFIEQYELPESVTETKVKESKLDKVTAQLVQELADQANIVNSKFIESLSTVQGAQRQTVKVVLLFFSFWRRAFVLF